MRKCRTELPSSWTPHFIFQVCTPVPDLASFSYYLFPLISLASCFMLHAPFRDLSRPVALFIIRMDGVTLREYMIESNINLLPYTKQL